LYISFEVVGIRLYKFRQKERALHRVQVEMEVKRKPQAYITEEEVRMIQAKEWLTLRHWTVVSKSKSKKVGKKHMFKKTCL
jgi:hypothetical protein